MSAAAGPAGRRRLWLAALCLYAFGAAADIGGRLVEMRHAGGPPLVMADLAVAFSAGLFWPVDLVAQALQAG